MGWQRKPLIKTSGEFGYPISNLFENQRYIKEEETNRRKCRNDGEGLTNDVFNNPHDLVPLSKLFSKPLHPLKHTSIKLKKILNID